MKKTLNELITEQIQILSKIEDNEGELSPELEGALTVNQEQMLQKTDNFAAFLDRLDHEILYYKDMAKKMSNKAKQYEMLHEILRKNLKNAMLATNTTEVNGDYFRFKLSKIAPKMTINESELPQGYFKVVQTLEVDKDKIKEAIDKGEHVTGVTMNDNYSLRQSMAKRI